MKVLKHLNILYIFKSLESKSLQYIQSKCKNLIVKEEVSQINEVLQSKQIDIIFSEKDISHIQLKKIREKSKNTHIIVTTKSINSTHYLDALKLKNIMFIDFMPKEENQIKNIFMDIIKNIDSNSSNIILLKDEFIYDNYNNTLLKDKQLVSLSKKEDMFLDYVIDNKDRAVSYTELNETLWEGEMTHNALRSVVKEVRRKTYKDLIKNISGVGYRIDI